MTDEITIKLNEKNWFGPTTISHKGVIYSVDDIVALRSESYSISYNFVPSSFPSFSVMFSNSKEIQYNLWTAFFVRKADKLLEQAFAYLSQITYWRRANIYLQPLKENGCFQYHEYSVHINGDLKYKNKLVNIAEAGLNGKVTIGWKLSTGKTSGYTPDIIRIHQKIPGKLFGKTIYFGTSENRDVISSIIIKMAESQGGVVKYVSP